MTEKETLSDGKVITRDEYGRFQSVELSSEVARSMAKSKHPNKLQNTNATTLLQEAGYTNESDAPEHLRLLAQIASSKRSGAVPALRDFRRLTRVEASEPAAADKRLVAELIGGSDEYIKVAGHMYSKLDGWQALDLVQLIKCQDAAQSG